jgi:hypothetical protein
VKQEFLETGPTPKVRSLFAYIEFPSRHNANNVNEWGSYHLSDSFLERNLNIIQALVVSLPDV